MKLLFCIFEDFYASGTQEAEVTGSLNQLICAFEQESYVFKVSNLKQGIQFHYLAS